jgi:ABC-type uncharacterized transport system substrate-binding protein
MRSTVFLLVAIPVVWAVMLAAHKPASAHPHILITVRSEIVYSSDRKIIAVRQSWTYDAAYSAYIIREFRSSSGELAADQLANLAKSQIAAFAEHSYFTVLTSAGGKVGPGEPSNYGFRQEEAGRLTLNFALPLKSAIPSDAGFVVEVFDPNFFAYFTMADDESAVRLIGAPEDCKVSSNGPSPIDLKNTRSIPALFWQALDGSSVAGQQFVNRIVVTCP